MTTDQGGGGVLIGIAVVAAIWAFVPKYTYRAEVGYYQNAAQAWFVGEDKTYDECISEATWRYNSINSQHPDRAFSWACRKMRGEDFLDRVR